jgi:prepilin-type N-terminal cleavage/methylation domain-containing protein
MKTKTTNEIRSLQSGFSLIEVSMVILIITVLIVAIIAGISLMKEAQLRSVVADFQNNITAYNNFKTRFRFIPGDFTEAFAYWDTQCSNNANNCNGNGNGIIDYSDVSIQNNEINQAWKHLELADMIDRDIATVTSIETIIGINAPASKQTAAGFILIGGTDAFPFKPTKNSIFLASQTPSKTLLNSAVTPEFAFKLDQKVDDAYIDNTTNEFLGGLTGNVRSIHGAEITSSGNCIDDIGDGDYNISVTSNVCKIGMLLD